MALDARPLVDGLSVSPQVTEQDIRDAHEAGFRTIINNRPDGEEPGQLSSAQAAEIARSLGLTYVYQPATGPTLEQVADAFGHVLATSPGPVLAHCRSGTRCTILWALAEAKAGSRDSEAILRAAASAGYDLSAYAPLIARYTQSRAE
ncbi:TIGR01244 family protein [Niveispirillum lacus]|uniref:TIGR01244 family protein n=1 Tax=Niveispirillum lacus TaxID=1981099 RepID=A0A255YVT6_9PROT|nr:TIGR01244 family sulfur transferase [Niveispirillum lacus]OYQ32540.1 TIGR01244 family protein [Niveispirillum lacus]